MVVLLIVVLIVVAGWAFNAFPILAIPPVLLIFWLINSFKDAIDDFFAYCFGFIVLGCAVLGAQSFLQLVVG
jgi:hypothetical protein